MASKWETFNYYLTAFKMKLLETTQSDPIYKKADYFMLTCIIAMVATVIVFIIVGLCYECCCCGKGQDTRRKSFANHTASVTYQDFTDEIEMQESPTPRN